MTATTAETELSSADALKEAVHQHRAVSLNGVLERLFTMAFGGLVYPQIWEDPVVDLAVMDLRSDHRVITIAAGGCNALSYMAASPASIIAFDLNPAHIALTKFKLAAARHLPVYEQFRRFFADADSHIAEQRIFFDDHIAPIFDKRLVRWLTGRRLSLYGLGIPPAQYEKLAGGRSMAEVLIERLRELACDFPLNENYFAWQAFARRYDTGETAALPLYLQRDNFLAIKRGAERITPYLGSLTQCLKACPADSFVAMSCSMCRIG